MQQFDQKYWFNTASHIDNRQTAKFSAIILKLCSSLHITVFIDVVLKSDHLLQVKAVRITFSHLTYINFKTVLDIFLITKSLAGHSICQNLRIFSPAVGIYWVIRLSIMPLNPSFVFIERLPMKLVFITKSLIGLGLCQNPQKFSPAANSPS